MTRSARVAVVAFVLAAAAATWLAAWPCFYRGIRSGPNAPEATTCFSLVAVNGTWVLGLLAVPPILTALGFFAVAARSRPVAWALAIVLVAACVLAAWSIGLFFLPSAIALLVAAAMTDR